MPRRSAVAKVVLLGSALTLSLFTVEAVLRSGLVPNPRYEYLRVDGDTEDPETRVLLLGDSFVGSGRMAASTTSWWVGSHPPASRSSISPSSEPDPKTISRC